MDNVHEINKTTNFYLQLQNHLNYNVTALGLAGMELIFFIVACMAQSLGFWFCDKTRDDNTAIFSLLSNTVCTALRPSLFSHFFCFPIPIISWICIRGCEETQLEQIFQSVELAKGYSLPYDGIMLSIIYYIIVYYAQQQTWGIACKKALRGWDIDSKVAQNLYRD